MQARTPFRQTVTQWALWLTLGAACTTSTAQTTLRLLHTARIEGGEPLRVHHVATLDGDRAAELGGIILAEDPEDRPTNPGGWFRIELDEVRDRIEQRLGPAAGLVAMGGSACDVRVRRPITPSPEPSDGRAPAPLPDVASTLLGLNTVRGAIARELVRRLHVDASDLRLEFDDRDERTLGTPTNGRTVHIGLVGNATRLPLTVAVYEPTRTVIRESVRVRVEVRRAVVLTKDIVPRAEIIDPRDVTTERRWVGLAQQVASPDIVLGAAARQRLPAGVLVEPRHIEPPVLIERGDEVIVRMIMGEMLIDRPAYARESGRIGETIEFSAKGDSKSRFRAIVDAKGRAVILPTGTPVANP